MRRRIPCLTSPLPFLFLSLLFTNFSLASGSTPEARNVRREEQQQQQQQPNNSSTVLDVLIGFSSREIEDEFLATSSFVNTDDEVGDGDGDGDEIGDGDTTGDNFFSSSSWYASVAANVKNNQQQQNETNKNKKKKKKEFYKFQYTNAISMKITREEWDLLEQDPNVLYVENNPTMYALEGKRPYYHSQTTPRTTTGTKTTRRLQEVPSYGLAVVQGKVPIPVAQTNEGCLINVCIVDSGLHVDHADIPYGLDKPEFIQGKEFGIPNDQFWYNAKGIDHGTEVAGIMIAKGGNGHGVVGIIPNGPEKSKICLLIARVFADSEGSTSADNVLKGVEWCSSKNAHVINLSLGGNTEYPKALSDGFQAVSEKGSLILAAAGNDESDKKSYPASLDSVMSIAAVNVRNERAVFSQFNDQVELTAPGDDIVTTQYGDGARVMTIQVLDEYLTGWAFLNNDFDDNFDFQIPREIADCEFGFEECTGVDGKVCLIQRDGEFTFQDKAVNCEKGGGAMALIYNHLDEPLTGRLEENNKINIPVFSLSLQDGTFIKESLPTSITSMTENMGGIGYVRGTSFSTPMVAAIAAKIWAARPECSNEQIREALVKSAFPLYAKGDKKQEIPNNEHGHGLVQAHEAYMYLLDNMEEPCGGNAPAETTSPTISPTMNPTIGPTKNPTIGPTKNPTISPTKSPPVCQSYMQSCQIDSDGDSDCCDRYTCRRISITDWACRYVSTATKQKLTRDGFCRGGYSGGCVDINTRRKRNLRGDKEPSLELPEEEARDVPKAKILAA